MKYLVILLLAACGPIPVQVSKTSQEQRMSSEQAQTASQDAAQSSAHQSESKQGTNSMPVIIICNQTNSPEATCVTPREGGALGGAVDSKLRKKSK